MAKVVTVNWQAGALHRISGVFESGLMLVRPTNRLMLSVLDGLWWSAKVVVKGKASCLSHIFGPPLSIEGVLHSPWRVGRIYIASGYCTFVE